MTQSGRATQAGIEASVPPRREEVAGYAASPNRPRAPARAVTVLDVRKLIAFMAAALLVASMSLTSGTSPAAAARRPQVSITTPASVTFGSAAVIKVKAKGMPKGGSVAVQRRLGVRWHTVKTIKRAKGSISVTGLPLGSATIRGAILKGRRVVAKSPAKQIRVTPKPFHGSVDLGVICQYAVVDGGCQGANISVGPIGFQSSVWLNGRSAFTVDELPRSLNVTRATSCSGMSIRVAIDQAGQMWGGSVTVDIVQGGKVLSWAHVTDGEIVSLTVGLSRAPFYVSVTSSEEDQALLAGEMTGCTTATGVI